MWRRTYLALVVLRLYFALSPSYLHPDEHFQGPEVIASHIFNSPTHLTWEFTSEHPIRSIWPLWLFYGWPLTVLKWLWEGLGYGNVPPTIVFYTLRLVMFGSSFLLEDFALHELLPTPRQQRIGIILTASSYVTWTWQCHTFSNAFETLILLWSLVLVKRIAESKESSQILSSSLLAGIVVLGTFNRITFPAFVVIPLLQLLPRFQAKPLSLLAMLGGGLFTLVFAIALDTEWYSKSEVHFSNLHRTAVIASWNNLMYNLKSSNLALHGLHPYYQHFLVNLPQLLGPALVLLLLKPRKSMQLYSALSGIVVLSCFRHQEARFLIPVIPLLLSSIDIPARFTKIWIGAWVMFNIALGLLMGIYHQGGIVPAQLWLSSQDGISQAFWWKTQSPPMYLLGQKAATVKTHDLMGRPAVNMTRYLDEHISCGAASTSVLVAPHSATFLDQYIHSISIGKDAGPFTLGHLYTYRSHLNMDDIDPGEEGLAGTLQRVIGRRGLGVWKIEKKC